MAILLLIVALDAATLAAVLMRQGCKSVGD